MQGIVDQAQPAACYGLACPKRGMCERFSALGLADGHVIDSCQTRDGWPLYLAPHGETMGGIDE